MKRKFLQELTRRWHTRFIHWTDT